jgi:hypothetical protein
MLSGRTRKVPVAGLTDGGLQLALGKLDRAVREPRPGCTGTSTGLYGNLDLGVTFREADRART